MANHATRRSGAFVEHAAQLRMLGLCPIPCGGEDGKRPLLRWKNWAHPPSPSAIGRLAARPSFAEAEIGIVTGLSGVTIVDCDDPSLLDQVLACCGPSPIIVRTPSGGCHVWYRASGERCADLRSSSLAIDVKGIGGFVVVPPSKHGGYRFERGAWTDLDRLPSIQPGGLERLRAQGAASAPKSSTRKRIPKGRRNVTLFRVALAYAPLVDSLDELIDILEDRNSADCEEPLSGDELRRIAANAMQYEDEGNNWVGLGGTKIANDLLNRLPGPFPTWLWLHLRRDHGARIEPFAIAARAMAENQSVPDMKEGTIRKATNQLVEAGLLEVVYQGGKGPGDARRYRFPERDANACSRRHEYKEPRPVRGDRPPNDGRRRSGPARQGTARRRPD